MIHNEYGAANVMLVGWTVNIITLPAPAARPRPARLTDRSLAPAPRPLRARFVDDVGAGVLGEPRPAEGRVVANSACRTGGACPEERMFMSPTSPFGAGACWDWCPLPGRSVGARRSPLPRVRPSVEACRRLAALRPSHDTSSPRPAKYSPSTAPGQPTTLPVPVKRVPVKRTIVWGSWGRRPVG